MSINSQHRAFGATAAESTVVAKVHRDDVLDFCCLRRGSNDGLEPAMKSDIMDFVLAEADSGPHLRLPLPASASDCSDRKSPKSTSSTTCSSDRGSIFTSPLPREEVPPYDSSVSSRSERGHDGCVLRGRLRSRGCTYEGELVNGVEHGDGLLSWDDGRSYRGQFADGRFNGLGEMSWPDGRRYVGDYQQDRKHGLGTFTWQDGRCYAGEWSHGKKHGFGVYKNAKGRTCQGVWSADQPVTMDSGKNPEQQQRHVDLQLQLHAQRLEHERQQQQHKQQPSQSLTKKRSFLLKPRRPTPPSPLTPGQGQDGDDMTLPPTPNLSLTPPG